VCERVEGKLDGMVASEGCGGKLCNCVMPS
jgi:hypothetical protein